MRAVLDASVVLKWALPEADTPKAVRLRNEARRGLHELLAPDIFPVEIAHGLVKAGRRGAIHPSLGSRRMSSVMRDAPFLTSYIPLLSRAFEIASSARIGVYECLYVTLAEREGCELVTADVRLLNALGGKFPFLVPLASLP